DNPDDVARIGLFSIAERRFQKKDLTAPPAEIAYGDSCPIISPDGKWLAFLRTTSYEVQELNVMSMPDGKPQCLTDGVQRIKGCAWTPNSREIVYATDRAGGTTLWRIARGGGQAQYVTGTGLKSFAPAISLAKSRLAYVEVVDRRDIWRLKL